MSLPGSILNVGMLSCVDKCEDCYSQVLISDCNITCEKKPCKACGITGTLSFAIPAKAIAEVISKLQPWLDVSVVLSSTGPLCCLKLTSQHGPATAAWRKLEEQGDACNPFRRV